jgi:hypothetical protein
VQRCTRAAAAPMGAGCHPTLRHRLAQHYVGGPSTLRPIDGAYPLARGSRRDSQVDSHQGNCQRTSADKTMGREWVMSGKPRRWRMSANADGHPARSFVNCCPDPVYQSSPPSLLRAVAQCQYHEYNKGSARSSRGRGAIVCGEPFM